MQKEKRQSQLLATLSQILKLYQKYLLSSLRGDLLQDRRAGLLENIRDRVRSIVDRYTGDSYGAAGQGLLLGFQQGLQKMENKLVSRFLGRLNEKVKGYMEQYAGGEVPALLTSNMQAIEKMSQNFNLPQLLTNLFTLGPRQRKQSRKNSSLYTVGDNPNPNLRAGKTSSMIGQASFTQKMYKYNDESKSNFLAVYTKKSNLIQQLIQLIKIVDIDEKDVRKRYFSIQQIVSQVQSQSQNNLRPVHAHNDPQAQPISYANFSLAITSSQLAQPHQQLLSTKLALTTNSYPFSPGQAYVNNEVYQDMVERNKAIATMMRKYETCYQKYKKKESIKLERQRQREKDRQRVREKGRERLSMPKIGCKEDLFNDIYSSQKDRKGIQKDKEEDFQIITRQTHRQSTVNQIPKSPFKNQNAEQSKNSPQKTAIKQQLVITPHPNPITKSRQISSSTDNPSLPELKTLKFEYNHLTSTQKIGTNIHNLNNKPSGLNKKAQKLLRITKPALGMSEPPQLKTYHQRKQKSISTSALTNINMASNAITLTNEQKQPPETQSPHPHHQVYNNNLANYSDISITASTFNNLNGIVRSKNLLNKLLNKVNSVSIGEVSGIVCLNRLQLVESGEKERTGAGTGDPGLQYADHNCKQYHGSIYNTAHNHSHTSNSSHSPPGHKTKKPPIYRQQLLQRRAKVQAMYNKTKPSQLGSLRNGINFPKIEQLEAPSFLMACRSYQKANQMNTRNIGAGTTTAGGHCMGIADVSGSKVVVSCQQDNAEGR